MLKSDRDLSAAAGALRDVHSVKRETGIRNLRV